MRAPFVPGSFTYSNLGGGASGGGGGALSHLLVSASRAEIVGGNRSSDRLLSALLMILGINRDERTFVEWVEEGAIDACDDTVDDKGSADAEGRTVGNGRVFERDEGDLERRALVWFWLLDAFGLI
jgi:hypothetical protein